MRETKAERQKPETQKKYGLPDFDNKTHPDLPQVIAELKELKNSYKRFLYPPEVKRGLLKSVLGLIVNKKKTDQEILAHKEKWDHYYSHLIKLGDYIISLEATLKKRVDNFEKGIKERLIPTTPESKYVNEYDPDCNPDLPSVIKVLNRQLKIKHKQLYPPEIKLYPWQKLYLFLENLNKTQQQVVAEEKREEKRQEKLTNEYIGQERTIGLLGVILRKRMLAYERDIKDGSLPKTPELESSNKSPPFKNDPDVNVSIPDADPYIERILEKSKQDMRKHLKTRDNRDGRGDHEPCFPHMDIPKLCIHNFDTKAFEVAQKGPQASASPNVAEELIPPLISTQKRIYLTFNPVNYLTAQRKSRGLAPELDSVQ